ncbi:Lysophospholipase, alpha-beta hydrolase superfamily [Dehalogenimonas formicexedens]|uniref:Monoacylglycerol lipase n=1 Tax=Dehalogenimonas formicexedens TaxID=1839801 RepID=A0A1P8F7J6_9CHLR|nr:alpha/beta hydrolase [Dehalogenimonas formicexedens]APV44428.1 Lysophospholipase, alpha-beta hydrolase superfamily [Dehalogenimonas formicexedens]
MTHLEGKFQVARHLSLFYQAWLPDNRQKAIIILVHGLADHSGRYRNVVNHLLPRGYAIWTYDQRGHGQSPGPRCYVNHFADLIDDLKDFTSFVASQNPGAPIFVVGHSMGALESISLATGNPQSIAGYALSGLLLKTGQNIPKLLMSASRGLSTLLPHLGVQTIECEAISRDESVVKAYISDPLVYTGKVPARMGAELITFMATVQTKLSEVRSPILLLHGSADRLASASSSQMAYDTVLSADKELHIFPGCYHEIFNEPCHDFVLGTLTKWLDRHLPA